MAVFVFAVPRIERMIAQHVKPLFGKMVFADVVDVFVVTPRKEHLIQSTTFRVSAVRRLEAWIPAIGIVGKELWKDDFLGICATCGKRVANHGPLGLAPQAQNLAEVMHETGENHPPRTAIAPELLGRLEQVLQL